MFLPPFFAMGKNVGNLRFRVYPFTEESWNESKVIRLNMNLWRDDARRLASQPDVERNQK